MGETKGKILVVDDEESICAVLQIVLTREGYDVKTVNNGKAALDIFRPRLFDAVIQDIRLAETNGLELLRRFKEKDPSTLVIMITAYPSSEIAVEAMRSGAYAYITKPFDNEQDIKATINRAVQFKQLLESSGNIVDADSLMRNIIGSTTSIKEIHRLIQHLSFSDSTILICGESGTGKELVARALHYTSSRFCEPFIPVNCGAFPDTLLESELFGYSQGAFTGAIRDKKGLLGVADKGTFFLDEVSELSPAMQVSLLRVIENKSFKPVGSTEIKKVDVRFVTATNADLARKVKKGEFREDLYYRLNIISIFLPSLRERKNDIPLLAGYFLAKYSKSLHKNIKRFTPETLETLMRYDWPGNVRELENMIHRAVALAEDDQIKLTDLKLGTQVFRAKTVIEEKEFLRQSVDLEKEVEKLEIKHIQRALENSRGSLIEAAKILNIKLRSLRYKIKKYSIRRSIFNG